MTMLDDPTTAGLGPLQGPPDELALDQPDQAELPDGLWGKFRAAVRDYGTLRETTYGFTPVLLISLIGFFQAFDTQAASLAFPDIATDLELNISDVIGLQATVGLITAFALLFAGWLADRVRRVPFIAFGTISSGIFSIFATRANSYASFATPRVLDDVGGEVGNVPGFSLFADYYPTKARGKAYALLGILSRGARTIAPVVAGVMIVSFGWRTALLVLGAPLIPLGILALVKLKEPIRGYQERREFGMPEEQAVIEEEPQSFGEGWRSTWAIRTFRRQFFGQLFFSMAEAPVGLFTIFLLRDEYGLDALGRGLYYTPVLVAGAIGGFVGGALIDRFLAINPSRILLLFGAFPLIGIVATLMLAFQVPIALLVVTGIFFGLGGALIGPAGAVIQAQILPPAVRTQGLQIGILAIVPASVLSLPLASTIFNDYGYRGVLLASIPLTIIGSIITMSAAPFFETDYRRQRAAATAAQRFTESRLAGDERILVATDVDVHYGNVQVLFGVDFEVKEGEIVALLGTNGAGKSTLLRALSGATQASNGAVIFDGRDTTAMPPNEVAARGIVMMPGGRGVFPGLSVRENLMLGNWMNDDPADVKVRLREVLEIFPRLRERLDVDASTLSGGEQQQLSLAQAFLARPKLLLIDELSLGLSPAVVGELIEIVKELNRRGMAIVVVEQSVNVALTIAERAVFMEKGEVRFSGPTKELLERPDILRAVYVKGTGKLTSGGGQSERSRRLLELGEAPPVLEVEGLRKTYGGVTAVDDVSLTLREGEVLGLIGPNGAGKTTLFDLISGYQDIDAGRVTLDSVDISDLSPDERAKRGLIRRFQDARLFGALTVEETMLVALEQQMAVRNPLLHAFRAPGAVKAERRQRARALQLIELLGLQSHRDKPVKELSTGLRRIVDLACVLAAEPKVLLLDEPSSGVAQAEAENLGPLLRRVRNETGCSILIIEHDMPLISSVSDELIALDQGAYVTRGTPDEVLNDPRVVESYLGTSEAAVNRSGTVN